jgi:co-chaperonin GroES (HSP10)
MLSAIGKRLLVKPIEVKSTASGLLLSTIKPTQFQVIQVGDEVTKVSVGQTVYIEKHRSIEIEHESEKFLVIEESSILAKLD